MPINSISEKKKALLAHKEKILQDIKYYEKRLEDFGANTSSHAYFEEGYSSDVEDDFPTIHAFDIGPTVPQLKVKQLMLKTCLQATQELTSLLVLQSEVNVMVEDPVIEGELPVKEPGSWREVTAECRIDLVPFSIMFHIHEPSRKFAAPSYRGLKVLPVKRAHETELAKSVLPGVTRPSDAVEVLRSYALAYRSRRTTLARLADQFAHNLFMEPLAEGGYLLKCANLLEISWRLENKWSPIAAFHHRMKFDLEYMDESYIKDITQAHKQLADPSLETDERTLLLSKIISTCLEAHGPTQELYESMESDPESVKQLEKRRTTLDQEIEAPAAKKKRDGNTRSDIGENAKDDQMMAPPKSLPKKGKPKGKENMDENRKAMKRSNVDEGSSNVKKAKTDVRPSVSDHTEDNAIKHKENSADNQNKGSITDTGKNKAKISTGQKNTEEESVKSTEKRKNLKKTKSKQDPNKIVDEKTAKNNDKPHDDHQEEITDANDELEERKKATAKEPVKQKVGIKNKNIATSKNDPNSKDAQANKEVSNAKVGAASKNDPKPKESAENEASKVKMVASSKNDPKSKDMEAQKQDGKNKKKVGSKNDQKTKELEPKKLSKSDKMTVSSKNDLNTKESEADKAASKARLVATSKNDPKTKALESNKMAKTDKMAVTSRKETPIENNANANQKLGQKETIIDNLDTDKTSKKLKTVAKTAKDKKDIENPKNIKKPDTNTDSANEYKKAVDNKQSNAKKAVAKEAIVPNSNKYAVSKESNVQNAKKDANKENARTAKASKTENASNKDKNKANRPEGTNVDKAKLKNKGHNSEKEPLATKEALIQKSKAIVNTKNNEEITTKQTNNPSKLKNSDKKLTKNDANQKSTSNGKGDMVEKAVKVKNVANRNKEHIADADNAANTKKADPKIAKTKNVQSKIAIQNLSHTNASAQNKLKRKSSAGNTENVKAKNLVTGSIAKNFKAGNTVKDIGSATKTSRIPQMKFSPMSERTLKKNPLRISPRKIPSTFKSASDSNIKKNPFVKLATNIPRLMKKPESKAKYC